MLNIFTLTEHCNSKAAVLMENNEIKKCTQSDLGHDADLSLDNTLSIYLCIYFFEILAQGYVH